MCLLAHLRRGLRRRVSAPRCVPRGFGLHGGRFFSLILCLRFLFFWLLLLRASRCRLRSSLFHPFGSSQLVCFACFNCFSCFACFSCSFGSICFACVGLFDCLVVLLALLCSVLRNLLYSMFLLSHSIECFRLFDPFDWFLVLLVSCGLVLRDLFCFTCST